MKVHCLSLTQPWASLVIAGEKSWETRDWKTSYRGTLIIQAARRFPQSARALCQEQPFLGALNDHCQDADTLPLGIALGTVELEDCLATEAIKWHLTMQELAFGDYGPDRYAFKLTHPRRFKSPVPLRGSMGIFLVELAIEDDWYIDGERKEAAHGCSSSKSSTGVL